jgi:CheY-like chemotaxis protein
MNTKRVLIVEDEPMIAMDLEDTITGLIAAVVIIKSSVADTVQVLPEPFDFAFLDVDVTNGKTYAVAHALTEKRVPFAFVSGSLRHHLPVELQAVPFVSKPIDRKAIANVLKFNP